MPNGLNVEPAQAEPPQWVHREYNCGLSSLTLPNAVR
jgi:hypothetical protein